MQWRKPLKTLYLLWIAFIFQGEGTRVSSEIDGQNSMPKAFVTLNRLLRPFLCALVLFFPLGSGAEEPAAQGGEVSASAESSDEVAEGSAPAADQSAEAARQRIDKFHGFLLEIMKEAEALGFEGRAKRLQELLPGYIDQDYMAQKALGRKWRKLTDEQQKDLMEAFGVLNVYSYADRFNGYSGEQFETLSSAINEQGDAKVDSQVVLTEGDPVRLLYRMHLVEGRWFVKDVYLNGSVSEMALRRSEYSSILKAEGFDALLVAIWAKSDSMMRDDMAASKGISKE